MWQSLFLGCLLSLHTVAGQDRNYLTHAHETAMDFQQRIKTSANELTVRLAREAEVLSKGLTDRVIVKQETISRAEQGYKLQGCILKVSTIALSIVMDIHEMLENVYHRSLEFDQGVILGITDKNLLLVDFQAFYSDLANLFNDTYLELDYVLNQIENRIWGVVIAKEWLYPMIDECLQGVE